MQSVATVVCLLQVGAMIAIICMQYSHDDIIGLENILE